MGSSHFMRGKLCVLIAFIFIAMYCRAQVPYFSGTPGNNNLYGYTSFKIHPSQNEQESYTCFQYGINDVFASGTDIYTGSECAYWGFLVRAGKTISPYLGIGIQVTPSFDLNDHFKYTYTTAALYLNGNITDNGKLFWCSNTWYGINKGADNSIANWEYIGYSVSLSKSSITPMLGCIHDWRFESDIDLSVGAYYSIGKWNIYLWGNGFFTENPRCVLGVDFKLPTL